MASLTPRYEAILGSACTGTDGALNRTVVLANTDYYSVIDFVKQGTSLHESLDFTISGDTVTFLVAIFDIDVIGLRYFTSEGTAVIAVATGLGYVSPDDVYRTSGVTSAEISATDVTAHILRAENVLCRITKNIYWRIVLDAQIATAGGASTITKASAGWTVNVYAGLYVWLYSGTGSVQIREIVSNTSDTLNLDRAWTTTNPASGALFKVFYVPTDFEPYIYEAYDGNNRNHFYLPYYPVKKVETLSIGENPVVVNPNNIYLWEKLGKIQFKSSAEAQVFSANYPLEVSIRYWRGVDHLPYDIKRLVELQAAFQILGQQMGGTFDDPSSISLPEVNISVGQAYINIRSSLQTMKEEYNDLLNHIKVWPVFA